MYLPPSHWAMAVSHLSWAAYNAIGWLIHLAHTVT